MCQLAWIAMSSSNVSLRERIAFSDKNNPAPARNSKAHLGRFAQHVHDQNHMFFLFDDNNIEMTRKPGKEQKVNPVGCTGKKRKHKRR